jgi:hypothetical protein
MNCAQHYRELQGVHGKILDLSVTILIRSWTAGSFLYSLGAHAKKCTAKTVSTDLDRPIGNQGLRLESGHHNPVRNKCRSISIRRSRFNYAKINPHPIDSIGWRTLLRLKRYQPSNPDRRSWDLRIRPRLPVSDLSRTLPDLRCWYLSLTRLSCARRWPVKAPHGGEPPANYPTGWLEVRPTSNPVKKEARGETIQGLTDDRGDGGWAGTTRSGRTRRSHDGGEFPTSRAPTIHGNTSRETLQRDQSSWIRPRDLRRGDISTQLLSPDLLSMAISGGGAFLFLVAAEGGEGKGESKRVLSPLLKQRWGAVVVSGGVASVADAGRKFRGGQKDHMRDMIF